jgi:hypothetical protein
VSLLVDVSEVAEARREGLCKPHIMVKYGKLRVFASRSWPQEVVPTGTCQMSIWLKQRGEK